MKSKIVSLVSVGLTLMPLLALAQVAQPATLGPAQLVDTINKISRWILTFALALVVAFVLWAAVLFITAGGDPSKVAEARTRVIYAVVGLVVALLAWSIPPIVRGILGV